MAQALYVLRHTETVLGHRGIVNGDPSVPNPLTARGLTHARTLAAELSPYDFSVCVTTEFLRTKQTADVILEGRDIARVLVPELNDPKQGKFEGQEFEIYAQWMESTGIADAIPGGGESQLDAVTRYARGWRRVAELDGVVFVVAHAFPISVALTLEEGEAPFLRRNYERDPEFGELNIVTPARLLEGLDALDRELQEFTS